MPNASCIQTFQNDEIRARKVGREEADEKFDTSKLRSRELLGYTKSNA